MRLTRNHLYAATAAGLVLAGMSLWPPKADALPIPHHVATGGFTPAVCLDSGAWSTTLTIDGTFLELHPVATIANYQAPLVATLPFSHMFIQSADITSITVSAHIVWDDGFTADIGPFTATHPDGCTPPTTVCPDCTPTQQTFPVDTTIPVVDTSVVETSPVTTGATSSSVAAVPPSSAPGLSSVPAGPSTSITATLPATGNDYVIPVAIGAIVGALCGLMMMLITIRMNRR